MNEERIAQALAAYVDQEEREQTPSELTASEREQLTALTQLSDRLERRMHPVSPPPTFVQSLHEELVEEAEEQLQQREHRRRLAMIGAAIVGSVVSVASLIGTIVVVVKWLRTRTQARHASTA